MYNGIGLRTARGSGTNGYVQANLSYLKPRAPKIDYNPKAEEQAERILAPRKANPEILQHDRKRQIEVECLKLQLDLEDKEMDEDDILVKVQELRDKLLHELQVSMEANGNNHLQLELKEKENAKFAEALGIKPDHRPGAAFDPQVAEQKKLDVQAERARKGEHLAEKELLVERKRLMTVLAIIMEEIQQGARPSSDMKVAEREADMKWDQVSREARNALSEFRSMMEGSRNHQHDSRRRPLPPRPSGDSYRPSRRSSRSPQTRSGASNHRSSFHRSNSKSPKQRRNGSFDRSSPSHNRQSDYSYHRSDRQPDDGALSNDERRGRSPEPKRLTLREKSVSTSGSRSLSRSLSRSPPYE